MNENDELMVEGLSNLIKSLLQHLNAPDTPPAVQMKIVKLMMKIALDITELSTEIAQDNPKEES